VSGHGAGGHHRDGGGTVRRHNIDGLIVLTALFMASAGGGLRPWQIVAGQYLGFAVMVAVSVLAAVGLFIAPGEWEGLIGLLPLMLGVRGLMKARHIEDGDSALPVGGLPSAAGVIIANGADNIAVYTPLFTALSIGGIAITIIVFFVLVGVWCALAWFLGGNKKVVAALVHVGKWLVPVVFIAIGAGILVKTGVLVRLMEAFV
jgi:cadmium resistance protein CadD (predicted permease)